VKLHRPWLELAEGETDETIVDLTPEDAGWTWSGLQVLRLEPGVPRTVRTGASEAFLLPLSGGCTVEITGAGGDGSFTLAGRASVFTAVSDFGYAGRDSVVVLTSAEGAEVALPSARCSTALPPAYGAAADVPVEVRGAGSATRQVTNFGVPGVWDHAEKLICCELITPPGNWSSYPPHKHDASEPCPVVNEEIYYYRIAGADQASPRGRASATTAPTPGPSTRRRALVRSTSSSRCVTTTSCSFRTAFTVRASRRRATRCTT
jgi:5-deoxy-glucuronate isomerase